MFIISCEADGGGLFTISDLPPLSRMLEATDGFVHMLRIERKEIRQLLAEVTAVLACVATLCLSFFAMKVSILFITGLNFELLMSLI